MRSMAEKRYVKLFSRFERFWHWAQTALVLLLLATGARMHGLFEIGHWGEAFRIHVGTAILLVLLWVFAIFWHFTTGEWRQYLPTFGSLFRVGRFYAWGIFRGEAHPAKPTIKRKHNPLQRLSYLFLKLVINPAIWITGALLLTLPLTGLEITPIAWWHIVAAYAMAVFVIVHIYMTTTGETVLAHIRPMITGYDWVWVEDSGKDDSDEAGYRRTGE